MHVLTVHETWSARAHRNAGVNGNEGVLAQGNASVSSGGSTSASGDGDDVNWWSTTASVIVSVKSDGAVCASESCRTPDGGPGPAGRG
jgi:type IV secretory pathway TrbL component